MAPNNVDSNIESILSKEKKKVLFSSKRAYKVEHYRSSNFGKGNKVYATKNLISVVSFMIIIHLDLTTGFDSFTIKKGAAGQKFLLLLAILTYC